MSTTCELSATPQLPKSAIRIADSETTRSRPDRAGSPAAEQECDECITSLLGISLNELSDLSRLLKSSVSGTTSHFDQAQTPPLALINACPLSCGDAIASATEALAVYETQWLSALSAMHILGHRFAKAAVDSEIDLHRVFHPLWRQTTNLAFAAELLARVTRRSESKESWLAGLCCGTAGLSSAIRSAKPDSNSTPGKFPRTTMRDIDRLTRDLEISSLVPLAATGKSRPARGRVWNVAATAATILEEVTNEEEWLIQLPPEIAPINLPSQIRKLLSARLADISAESQRMNSVLWRSPLKTTH